MRKLIGRLVCWVRGYHRLPESAMHASAPAGYQCADCYIDHRPCDACLSAALLCCDCGR